MPNNDYILRSDALKAVCENCSMQGDEGKPCSSRCEDYAFVLKIPAADVEPKRKWISVTERLPEEKISPMTMDYTEYPCVFDGRAGQREVRYYKFGKGHFWHGTGCIDEYVTYWAEPMPLPEPPKEGQTDE